MPVTRTTTRADVAILDPDGRMCLSDNYEDDLKPLISNLLEQGSLKFLLNLHRVESIDSTGLGSIVRAYVAVTRKGGKLKLCSVSRRIRQVLEITKMSALFEAFDSEEEALRSFEGPVSTVE
jgi:anti-anti-sigma factor